MAALALDRLRQDSAVAPALWWYEVRNILIVSERRGRIAETDTASFLRLVGRFGITLDRNADELAVLSLARRHRLTVYDAGYLELAQREGLALATLDRELVEAARAEGLSLLE